MKVVERINELLKIKGLSKKELAKRLINLGMKANKTGEVPTLSSIYAYLNGNIDIKADMIPFIADAMGVYEQELFSDKEKENQKAIHKICTSKEHFKRYESLLELIDALSAKNIRLLESILLENLQKDEATTERIKEFKKMADEG